jgi:hypothetical protein
MFGMVVRIGSSCAVEGRAPMFKQIILMDGKTFCCLLEEKGQQTNTTKQVVGSEKENAAFDQRRPISVVCLSIGTIFTQLGFWMVHTSFISTIYFIYSICRQPLK